MDQYEIKETFDFELDLAKLLLKEEPWQIQVRRLKFTNAKESRVDRAGDIYISLTKWENSRNYVALREEIRGFFTDLHTDFIKREKFLWQRIARKLNLIPEKPAEDQVECELCQKPTPLTHTARCLDCRKIEQAVLGNPEVARRILESINND